MAQACVSVESGLVLTASNIVPPAPVIAPDANRFSLARSTRAHHPYAITRAEQARRARNKLAAFAEDFTLGEDE